MSTAGRSCFHLPLLSGRWRTLILGREACLIEFLLIKSTNYLPPPYKRVETGSGSFNPLKNPSMAFGRKLATLLRVSILLGLLSSFGEGHLSLNYYSKSCPRAEDVVKEEVAKLYHKHHDTAVSWVRNLFHDCMVKSCDASLLLETTNSIISEQTSPRSFGMKNFKYITTIKKALERECPNTVSCADVVALSAREGVLWVR